MRVVGLALLGGLTLTVPIETQAGPVGSPARPGVGPAPGVVRIGMVMVRAGIQCPTVGTVTGVEYPVLHANGKGRVGGFGRRTALLAAGFLMRGREFPLIGSGVPATAPLIIRSRIGVALPGLV